MACEYNKIEDRINTSINVCELIGDPVSYIAYLIVATAVNDYKTLIAAGKYHITESGVSVSIGELESFFNSEWCDYLLQQRDAHDLMKRLNIKEVEN